MNPSTLVDLSLFRHNSESVRSEDKIINLSPCLLAKMNSSTGGL